MQRAPTLSMEDKVNLALTKRMRVSCKHMCCTFYRMTPQSAVIFSPVCAFPCFVLHLISNIVEYFSCNFLFIQADTISMAQHRINATRKLVGSAPVLPDYGRAKVQEALLVITKQQQ